MPDRDPVAVTPTDNVAAGAFDHPVRLAVAIAAGVGGLTLTAAMFETGPWSWVLWLVVGVLVGSIARRGRDAWITIPILAGFYLLASAVGILTGLGTFWWLWALTGIAAMSVGYAVGTLLDWRVTPWDAARSSWRARSRNVRRSLVGGVVLALVAMATYTGYVGAAGSEEFIHPTGGWNGCDTPGVRFHWSYEPINYDAADDAALVAARTAAGDPQMLSCGPNDQGSRAGDAVTSSDGIRLDGWYIPASAGTGPTGPTIIVVPGYTSNKSEILLYATAFHRDYNLVLMDLRNQGRSSRAEVTLGFDERRDVAAMLDWLIETKHPTWIGAMGNSMGAATVLAEAMDDPRIQALILDSMHARLELSAGNILETERNHPSIPGAWAMMAAVSLRTGSDLSAVDPAVTITKIGKRPVLLLHSTTDRIDPPAQAAEVNFHAALDAGVPVELHYCEGNSESTNGWHGRVIELCPAEWTRWANQFLAAARGT